MLTPRPPYPAKATALPSTHARRLSLSLSDPAYPKHPSKPQHLTHSAPPSKPLRKTLLWILVAAVVALLLALLRGRRPAMEFITGYIVEYSLSIDNLFVFLLIFRYFKVPPDAQQKVLTYGIFGAMALRAIMIIAGKALVERFEWLALAFAALLIYSAGKLLLEDDDDDDLENNRVIKFSKAILPVSDHYAENKFFVRADSQWLATPLTVVLVAIELSDVLFAIDSVPAVLGVSNDVFVIYTSNILAIMGLRSLFFVLSTSLANLRYLKHALSIVLAFIGVKMIAGCLDYDFGVVLSLLVVVLTLLGGVVLSIAFPGPSESSTSLKADAALTAANSV